MIPLGAEHPFGPHNLPWCAFRTEGGAQRLGVRLGDDLLDVAAAQRAGALDPVAALGGAVLNPFLAQGRGMWDRVRAQLGALVHEPPARLAPLLVPLAAARLQLPVAIGDYVDFYSSQYHAANVGRILRPGQPPLLENWWHLPIGYHGRAGTVVISGTPIRRPVGQLPGPDGPVVGPTQRLDVEVELGFIVGRPSQLGVPLSTEDFTEYVFGAVVVNDWSARDIQAWEYRPLGPFLGKSFATSISPFVVPLAALAPARVPAVPQQPPVAGYLREADRYTYQIDLELRVNETRLSQPPFALLYWTPAQQLAHLTSNGASVRAGDLYASGTISGPDPGQLGSLLELTHGGAQPLALSDGATRAYLADGDRVSISALATGADGTRIGFGAVTGTVLPVAAHPASLPLVT